MRDAALWEAPGKLWGLGESIRAADLGGNNLSCLPPTVASLTSLSRLRLSNNQLISEGVPWAQLACLSQLTVLALDHNRCFTSYSSALYHYLHANVFSCCIIVPFF